MDEEYEIITFMHNFAFLRKVFDSGVSIDMDKGYNLSASRLKRPRDQGFPFLSNFEFENLQSARNPDYGLSLLSSDSPLELKRKIYIYSNSKEETIRMSFLDYLPTYIGLLGLNRIKADLIPFLCKFPEETIKLKFHFMKRFLPLVQTAEVRRDYDFVSNRLVPLILEFFYSKDNETSPELISSTIEILKETSKLLSQEDLGRKVLTFVIHMATDSKLSSKILSARVISQIVDILNSELNQNYVLPQIISLSEEPVVLRRVLIDCIVKITNKLTLDSVLIRLVPLVKKFCLDVEWEIRQQMAYSIPCVVSALKEVKSNSDFSCKHAQRTYSDIVSKVILCYLDLVYDRHNSVRLSSIEVYGKLVYSLEYSYLDKRLLDVYSQSLSSHYLNNQGHLKSQQINSIIYSCVYNLPAVCLSYGGKDIQKNIDIRQFSIEEETLEDIERNFRSLDKVEYIELQGSPNEEEDSDQQEIRFKAKSTESLNGETAEKDFGSTLLKCLKYFLSDNDLNIQHTLLSASPILSDLLGDNTTEKYLVPFISECFNKEEPIKSTLNRILPIFIRKPMSIDSKLLLYNKHKFKNSTNFNQSKQQPWRSKISEMQQIGDYYFLFDSFTIYKTILPLLISRCLTDDCDRVRQTAASYLSVFIVKLLQDDDFEEPIYHFLDLLANSDFYKFRVSYIRAVSKISQCEGIFNDRLYANLLRLARDIPDVQYPLAKRLVSVIGGCRWARRNWRVSRLALVLAASGKAFVRLLIGSDVVASLSMEELKHEEDFEESNNCGGVGVELLDKGSLGSVSGSGEKRTGDVLVEEVGLNKGKSLPVRTSKDEVFGFVKEEFKISL